MLVLAARVKALEKEVSNAEKVLREKRSREHQIADELVAELDHTIRSSLALKLRD